MTLSRPCFCPVQMAPVRDNKQEIQGPCLWQSWRMPFRRSLCPPRPCCGAGCNSTPVALAAAGMLQGSHLMACLPLCCCCWQLECLSL